MDDLSLPRPPGRAWPSGAATRGGLGRFSPTPPSRSAPPWPADRAFAGIFRPLRTRGDIGTPPALEPGCGQARPPKGERTMRLFSALVAVAFFVSAAPAFAQEQV